MMGSDRTEVMRQVLRADTGSVSRAVGLTDGVAHHRYCTWSAVYVPRDRNIRPPVRHAEPCSRGAQSGAKPLRLPDDADEHEVQVVSSQPSALTTPAIRRYSRRLRQGRFSMYVCVLPTLIVRVISAIPASALMRDDDDDDVRE